MSFLNDMKNQTLIGDGAIGTYLYLQGVNRCFEELNLTESDKVKQVHQAYIEAGAQLIQTNTYAANAIKLKRHGLEDKVAIINQKAVEIAKEAIATTPNTYVVGTLGGVRGFQKGAYSLDEITYSFEEQLDSLLSSKVDGILLETFYDFDEIKACIKRVKRQTDLPVISHVSLDEVGVLYGGVRLGDALVQLANLGSDVVGLNCRMGPFHMLQSLEEIPLIDGTYLSAYPNASLPDYIDGRLVYQSNPQYFGASANDFHKQGVRLIGGCCGTTPDHIKSIAEAVKGKTPIREKEVKKDKNKVVVGIRDKIQPISDLVVKKKSVIVELDPPKKLNIHDFLEGSKKLKEVGVDAITLADNSLASPRVCNLTLSSIIKDKFNANPLVHITCRDRNLIGLQSHLMGLHTLGIHQVLAVTGDPTKIGDFPGATSVYDVASFDLIRLIKQMNEGISFSGKSLGEKTNFSVGAAFNPNVKYIEKAVQRLEKKITSGADYFLTQPVYCEEQIHFIYEATKHLNVPIYIGIMPLTSSRNAEFLHNEVPGIKLTDEIRQKMLAVQGDKVASELEGLQIAKKLIDQVHRYFNGLYLITPFIRYNMTVELTEYWNEKNKISKRKLV